MKPRPHHQGAKIPPAKPGPNMRPDIVHKAMWLAYIFDGLSASETADQLNRELRVKETRGSVLAYAWRQEWQKAHINQVPCLVTAVADTAVVDRPVSLPVKSKGPLAQDRIEPPAPRRRTGPIAYLAPPPPPKRETPVDLAMFLPRAAPDYTKPAHLAALHSSQCRFPIGRVVVEGMEEHQFCGKRKSEGEPYCGAHCKRAFNPNAKKAR